jgi:hypothetical protein
LVLFSITIFQKFAWQDAPMDVNQLTSLNEQRAYEIGISKIEEEVGW